MSDTLDIEFPDRLSCEADDPGYVDFKVLESRGVNFEVWLDGERYDRCITADRREGWIKIYDTPLRVDPHRNCCVTSVLNGTVEFRAVTAA